MINERVFNPRYKQCFCSNPELIENYDKAIADSSQVWECHHRLETHNSDGERRLVDLSKQELIALGMYMNRPPEEFIFLTGKDHATLHYGGKPAWNRGKHISEETRGKLKKVDKSYTKTDEYRQNMSKVIKSRSLRCREAYKEYSGPLKWNEFQREFYAIQKEESK